MRLPPDLLPLTAAATTAIMLGASFVAVRWVLGQIEPVPLAFLRYLLAFLSILPFGLVGGALFRFRRDEVAVLAVLGILQFGVFHMCFNAGLALIPAGRAAVIFSLVPFCTLAIGACIGYERLDRRRLLGVLLTIAGVVVALGDKAASGPEAAAAGWRGEGLILVAVVCGSTFNAFSRPFLARHPPAAVVALAMGAGAAYLLPMGLAGGVVAALPGIDAAGWLAVFYLAVPIGSLGFFLFSWSIRRTSPTRTAVFLPLSPLSATLFGALLLDEPITVPFAIGLAMVLAGIWLAQLAGRLARPRGGEFPPGGASATLR